MSAALEAALAGPPVPLSMEYPRCTDVCHSALSPAERRILADRERRLRNKGKAKRREQCTPPPCSDCGGVESHVRESCSVHRAMSRVPSPVPVGPRPPFPWE